MKKVAVCGAEVPRVFTMPLGSSRNWEIWFRKEPTSRDPRKVVMTCSSRAGKAGRFTQHPMSASCVILGVGGGGLVGGGGGWGVEFACTQTVEGMPTRHVPSFATQAHVRGHMDNLKHACATTMLESCAVSHT